MTDKTRNIIDRKIEDCFDELHDLFVSFHEQGIQFPVSDYVQYVYPRVQRKMIELSQDLADEFDEEEE